MSNNRSGSFFSGMIIGAALGTVAGILMAPRTGRETRQLLKKSADALPELAEDLSTTVQLQADRLSETALRNWDGTLGRLREAIAAGLEATRRESQLLNRDNESGADPQPPIRDRIR
jgi:gas vesicle protein